MVPVLGDLGVEVDEGALRTLAKDISRPCQVLSEILAFLRLL